MFNISKKFYQRVKWQKLVYTLDPSIRYILGHLAIAGYMTEFTPIEQVWFVVSPHNPLKKKETLLEDHQRLYMAQLAIGDNDRLKATDIEFKLPSPSYTVNTLAYLEEKYPQHSFKLVLGEDNLYTFHKWKNAEELISKYQYVCVSTALFQET